jgi:aminopeptidase N
VLDTAQTELMQLLNANSYQKGGFVLHMLRRTVGDSAFFAGVRGYYENGRHSTALTGDLRLAMERASRMDLGWFFDQWLRRPGFAEGELAWRHDAASGTLVVTITQDTRFRPYRLRLPVEVEEADGTRRMLTLDVPAQGRAQLTLREQFTAAPRALRPDPLGELLAVIRTR